MKKLLLTLFTVLTALQGWGVGRQTYENPSELPEAFEWTMVRDDYYATSTSDPVLVNTQEFTVKWDPTYENGLNSYGLLTIENFYNHNKLNQTCTLNFDNEHNNCNFQWNADMTECTFSLTAFKFAEATNTSGVSYPSAKNAYINSATYNISGRDYWIKPSYATSNKSNYLYGGGSGLTFSINIIDHTFTIVNNSWGVFMLTSSYTSYVLESFAYSIFREKEPTTLAWIEANGEKEQSYTIADRLMGVYANGTSLWCKDLGNISNVKTEPATGAIDYMSGLMSELHQRSTADEWDQSNWVELVCDNAGMATSGKGKYIKAGTVTGKYTDDVNYTIRVTGTSLELDGEATYEPNYYSPVNFMCYSSAEQDNTSVQGTYGGRTYYFVNPKVQEYAIPTIAVWRGNNEFAMAARDVVSDRPMNTAGLPGAYKVQWGLNNGGDVSARMLEHEAYEFHAIVRRATDDGTEPASVPARAQSTLEPMSTTASADYEVWPLDLDPDNFNIVTEITAVGSDEPDGDGYYYTLTGQRVTNPAPGFYIHNGRKVIVR